MSSGSQKTNIVITDTSCFILLDKVGLLFILEKLYLSVITTPEIAKEFGKPLPNWVEIRKVANSSRLHIFKELVDEGEASAIALAVETPLSTLMLDDMEGRRLAGQLNLKFTGTIGVLVKAKEENIILSLKNCLDTVKQTNFRIAPTILDELVKKYEPDH